MLDLISFSDVDTTIQRRMSQRAPEQGKRIEAINDSMLEVFEEFDIKSARRTAVLNAVLDGTPFKIENLIDDLKSIKDIRYLAKHKQLIEFSQRDEDDLAIHKAEQRAIDEYSLISRDGERYLAILSRDGANAVQLHGMDSVTNNGTWEVDISNSDASNLETTQTNILDQGISLKFDVDVSQSSNNYAFISNSTLNALDLTDYKDVGRIRMNIKIPNVDNITSIELRWGNDASNYYSKTITTQSDGSAFNANWNKLEFDWSGATENGTISDSAIDYLAIKLNYGAAQVDMNAVVIEAIELFVPQAMKIVYETFYTSKDDTNSTFENIPEESADNPENNYILLPKKFKRLIVVKALKILFPMALGWEEAQDVRNGLVVEERSIIKHLNLDNTGDKPKSNKKKVKPRGW